MGFSKRFHRKKEKDVIVPTEKIEKTSPRLPLENRLADLKEAGVDMTIHIERKGVPLSGQVMKYYNIQEIEPGTFKNRVGQDHGGGEYELYFTTSDGRVMMLETDRRSREVYHFRVAGPLKKDAKEPAERKPQPQSNQNIVDGIFTRLGNLITQALPLIQGLFQMFMQYINQNKGTQQSLTLPEMLEAFKSFLAIIPQQQSESLVEQLRGAKDLINELGSMKSPPVDATGPRPGSMLENALNSFLTGIGPALLNRNNGGSLPQHIQNVSRPGAISPTPGQWPAGNPAEPQPTAGLAGASDAAISPYGSASFSTPTGTFTDASQSTGPMTGEAGQAFAVNPLLSLRGMIAREADPEEVSDFVIEALNTYLVFGEGKLPPLWSNFLYMPEVAFDALIGYVPEIADKGEYKAKLREGTVEKIVAWREEKAGASGDKREPEPGEVDDAESQQGGPGQDDGEPVGVSGDEGQDPEGQDG